MAMDALEKKRKEIELMKVRAARMDMELQIDERLADIERIKTNIENQLKREAELEKLIKGE